MNRTTNAELLKVAMDYLPLYDLTVNKMAEDYLACNYGDFMTRFLYRMAYEGGKRIENMIDKEMVDQVAEVMSVLANDIHRIIDSKKNDSLGILSPSCAFLHEIGNIELVKLHFEILYPLLAHHRRNDIPAFMECEHPRLLLCYPKSSHEDLFRMSKMVFHTSCGKIIRDVYIGILGDFVKLYQALDFQTSREYADFAEQMGNMRVEGDKDLYDKTSHLWEYKVCHAIGFEAPENEFQESMEKYRVRFDSSVSGHVMYVADMFLNSNTGMMDSKFGVKAVQCLDYYLSLRVPLEEMKEARKHV